MKRKAVVGIVTAVAVAQPRRNDDEGAVVVGRPRNASLQVCGENVNKIRVGAIGSRCEAIQVATIREVWE
jgi:hypothetical protein